MICGQSTSKTEMFSFAIWTLVCSWCPVICKTVHRSTVKCKICSGIYQKRWQMVKIMASIISLFVHCLIVTLCSMSKQGSDVFVRQISMVFYAFLVIGYLSAISAYLIFAISLRCRRDDRADVTAVLVNMTCSEEEKFWLNNLYQFKRYYEHV